MKVLKNPKIAFSEMIVQPFCCLNCDFFYRWQYINYFNYNELSNYGYNYNNFFYNYSEIITIQLTSYLNLKPVNWNFVNKRLTVQLSGFGSQPYMQVILIICLSGQAAVNPVLIDAIKTYVSSWFVKYSCSQNINKRV